jgi:hypothetical protein
VVGVVAVLGIVAVVLIIANVKDEVDKRVDNGTSSFSDNSEHPPDEDARLDECGPAAGTNFMRATINVRNPTSKPSNYLITVAFESKDGGTQLGTSIAGVNALGSNQSTTEEANSFQEAPDGQDFDCRITRVERFAA